MARSCHLPLWEAGGIVDSDEQCESIHLQPVSRRSEYLGLFDAGLYSSRNSICSWSFFFPCNCPSSRGQCPLVSTLQYWSGDHNIIFARCALSTFCLHTSLSTSERCCWSVTTKLSTLTTCLFCIVGKWRSMGNLRWYPNKR